MYHVRPSKVVAQICAPFFSRKSLQEMEQRWFNIGRDAPSLSFSICETASTISLVFPTALYQPDSRHFVSSTPVDLDDESKAEIEYTYRLYCRVKHRPRRRRWAVGAEGEKVGGHRTRSYKFPTQYVQLHHIIHASISREVELGI